MKKFFSILLAFSVLTIQFTAVNADETEQTIKKGDYLKMGVYNETPMLWKCLYIDEFGPLMANDRIISFKSYDAPGEHETDDFYGNRKKYGSTRWADSNLRSWLNSDEENVTWICGNPPLDYADERGFITNFSDSEKAIIKTVKMKNLLVGCDLKYKQTGKRGIIGTEFDSDGHLASIKGYDEAYAEYTEDKFFIPDLKDNKKIDKQDKTVLCEFNAIRNCDTVQKVHSNGYGSHWTRAPLFAADYRRDSAARYLFFVYGNYVSDDLYWISDSYGASPNEVLGVRPMFYADINNFKVHSGDGTKENPFVLENSSDFTENEVFAYPTESTVVIDNIPIKFDAYNIYGNNYFKLRDVAYILNNTKKYFSVSYEADYSTVNRHEHYTPVGGELEVPDNVSITEALQGDLLIRRGESSDLESIGYKINGNNYYKIRTLGKMIDFNVTWDGDKNAIYIDTNEGYQKE